MRWFEKCYYCGKFVGFGTELVWIDKPMSVALLTDPPPQAFGILGGLSDIRIH